MSDFSSLEQQVNSFRADHGLALAQLSELLDKAGISHYSSGCGTKRVTFDLFPASEYIRSFEKLLRLDRQHLTKLCSGYKDARADYNPATEFVQFLTRWSQFAQQAMSTEGETARGIAAGRAKLLLDDLAKKLSEEKPAPQIKMSALGKLMIAISSALETREKSQVENNNAPKKLRAHHNYLKALAAAQNAA